MSDENSNVVLTKREDNNKKKRNGFGDANSASNAVFGVVVAVLLIAVIALSGCSSTNTNSNTQENTVSTGEGIAAVVDGTSEITEEEVSKYINQYRLYNNLESDADWASLLDESGTTAADARQSAIEHFALNIAVQKKAEEVGISVEDSEIDDQVTAIRTSTGATSDTAWQDLLTTSGYDSEDEYREDTRIALLTDKLVASISTTSEPSDAQLQSYANLNTEDYVGKKLVITRFAASRSSSASALVAELGSTTTEENFRSVSEKYINSGKASSIESAGWTCLMNDASANMDDAIADKEVGELASWTDDDGTLIVAYIAEEYYQTNSDKVILSEMPSEIRQQLETNTAANTRSVERTNYLNDLLNNVEITVADMPEGLDYDVDMSLSTYGEETTSAEDEAAAQELINEGVNELIAANNNSNS